MSYINIKFIKSFFGALTATTLTLFLLYIAKDYPCLRGAGLSMADSEAFILIIIFAMPCLFWAIKRLIFRRKTEVNIFFNRLLNYMAIFTIIGVLIFFVLAIPLIFFTSYFPLRLMCEQPYLSWLFKFPM